MSEAALVSIRLAVITTVTIGILVGCGGQSPQPPQHSDRRGGAARLPSPSASRNLTPTRDLTLRLRTDAPCVVSGDLEGQFTSSNQMPEYLECVLPALVEWTSSTYARMPLPRAFRFVPVGQAGGRQSCPYDEGSLQYCHADNVVYLGELAVWDQYVTFGDAAPAVVLAHELVHHFQNQANLPWWQLGSANEQVRFENQADCGAGAFMRFAQDRGFTDRADDVVDLAGALVAGSQAEGPGRTHGTVGERLASFDSGFFASQNPALLDCVRFVPETPIVD